MPDQSEIKREPRPAPHPKELSPEYHKAHKQLMLWAAILFIWEFVEINLDKAKDAEGTRTRQSNQLRARRRFLVAV